MTKKDITRRAATVEAAAEWVDRTTLKPWAKNPRNNADNVKRVMASIQRFGFAAPILARKADGEVIAGHTRLLAAEALGIDRVPVRYLDLDPADAHMLAIADNRLTEKSEWDNALLMEQLDAIGLDNAELVGFDSSDLDAIAGDVVDENALPELEDKERNVLRQMVFMMTEEDEAFAKTVIGSIDVGGDEKTRTTAALLTVLRHWEDS